MNDGITPMEIELKLVLPGPEAEAAVVTAMRENGYTVEEIGSVRQVDTYLDTFDWALMKNKFALRYRVSSGSAAVTLKGIGSIEDGIAKRTETEIPIDRPVDVPALLRLKRVRELVGGMIFPRRLIEQVQVRTERRQYRVASPEGAEIELAFDTSLFSLRGLYKPRRAQKLIELEAEIRNGPEAALGALASFLSGKFNYPPSPASKLEVAIGRFRIAIPSKKPPENLKVGRNDRVDLALRKILTYQFQRLHEQLPGVLQDIDTEFVHQARVATRRMRSALRLFHGAVPEGTAAYLAEELKWLGGVFGAVRDLDVFLLSLSRFKQQIKRFPGKQKRAFENWIERHRRPLLKALCGALESSRYSKFERQILRFLKKPLPIRPRVPLARKTVGEAAPVLIRERLDAVNEQGRAVIADPKLKQYHRLRIQMKRLRYLSEFVGPAYEGALDAFIARAVEIQDCLGELQDTVFTRKFVDVLLDDWKGKLVDPDLLFVLGEVYQLQAEIARERREAFAKMWEGFASEEILTLLDQKKDGKAA